MDFRRIVLILLLGATAADAATRSPELTKTDAYLNTDNIRMIALLRSLTNDHIGEKIDGLTLQDGTLTLRNAVFLGSLIIPQRKQHIYTFRVAGRESSWVWIEPRGMPLEVPLAPKNNTGASAFTLAGDAYRQSEVQPGAGVIVLPGGSRKWIKLLKEELKAYDRAGLR
jgi:hypothetical protein